jgi:predicted nucleic acid-binding protein
MTDVAVDACCLINLLAAENILSIPSKAALGKANLSFGFNFHVPAAVSRESLYLLRPDEKDENKLVKAPIDLTAYFKSGVLIECGIESEAETNLFVQYAMRLDDGEAACMALANNRGWSLATDDRLATTVAKQEGVTVLTTAELVKQWSKSTKAKKQEIATVLLNIQRFAKFVPRQISPESQWWLSHFPKL